MRFAALVCAAVLLDACSLATSLDNLGDHDASTPDSGADGVADVGSDGGADVSTTTDGATDATVDVVPKLLCGAAQCDPLNQLCCVEGSQAFCTQTCAGPDIAITCDDSRQCAAKHDSGTWSCCLQPYDAGTNAASLCGSGCLQVACNPTAPACPNSLSCTGVESVAGYPLHYCQ